MKKTTLFISALMTCTLLASSGIYTADELNTDYGHIENDFKFRQQCLLQEAGVGAH